MSGDLSITPPPGARDLSARAAGPHATAPRPGARDDGASARALQSAAPPDPIDQTEAARLRTLLTDPAMQVSTHRDNASGRSVLQIQSRATGEIVEQIPSEALLRLYATLREALVDERA